MNTKLFIKQQIKSMLSQTSIFGILIIISSYIIGNITFTTELYNFGLLIVGYEVATFAVISSCFILEYRTSLNKLEFYRQAPYNKNRILLTRMLIMAIMITIILFISYISFFLGTSTSSARTMIENMTEIEITTRFSFKDITIGFVLSLFGSIISMILSCFVGNFSNTKFTIFISSVTGTCLLSIAYMTLTTFCDLNFDTNIASNFIPSGFGFLYVQAQIGYDFSPDTTVAILDIVVPLILSGLVIYYLFKTNEPSAEYAGKVAPRSIVPDISYHGLAAIVFLYLGCIERIGSIFNFEMFALIIYSCAVYYFGNCIRLKRMKPTTNELIVMLCCSLGPLLIGFSSTFI